MSVKYIGTLLLTAYNNDINNKITYTMVHNKYNINT